MKNRDENFYREIGSLGGQSTLARHGVEHFSAIGKKGGELLLDMHGTAYFSRVARSPRNQGPRKPRARKESSPFAAQVERAIAVRFETVARVGYDVYGDGLELIG